MASTDYPPTTTIAGEEGGAEGDRLSPAKFTSVDYALFVLMLVASVSIGVVSAFRSRRKTSTQEYLLGGRNMPPIAVALSLLGGWVSAISILGNPTEIYFYGSQLCVSLLGTLPGALLVYTVVLPITYNLQLVSINEYIELRYGSAALRKVMSLSGILLNFFYMGICLYAPTLAMATFTNLPTWAATVIMGSICTIYITIGGVKAVVYTDVLQTLLMFGGVLMVVVLCCYELGGAGEVWRIAEEGGRAQFFNLDTSPFERHTFLSTLVLGFYIILSNLGLSPSQYQRFASVSSLNTAKGLAVFFLVGLWILWLMFFFSGMVAYAVYHTCDPLTSGKIQKPDQIIPFLVQDKLSHLPGLAGIFLAAVYGGVLSSLSTCANSVACIIWEDWLKPIHYFNTLSAEKATRVVKIISAFAGICSIVLGILVEKLGSIFQVVYSVCAAFAGPKYGVYITGLLVPWVNTKGITIGYLTSLVLNLWLVVGKFMRGGGSPASLPLSTAGCSISNTTITTILSNTTNTILFNATTDFISTTTTSSDIGDSMIGNEVSEKTFYELSYCYVGILGMAICLVVGSIASLFTGLTNPYVIREDVMSPTCLRGYRWVWRRLHGTKEPTHHRNNYAIKMQPSSADKDTYMLPDSETTKLPS